MAPTETKQWRLVARPKAIPTYGTGSEELKFVTVPLKELSSDQVLVKTLYLSNDPAQRAWMDDTKGMYVEPVPLDTPMRARGLGKVVSSTSSKYKEGQLVAGPLNWSEYVILDAKDLMALPELPGGLDPAHYLGALGGTGLTAYYGLVVIGGAQKGQSLVVSGAAGATGSMVVQIAKNIVGCSKVIGMAGTDEKCRWVESLGADVCLNYKSKSFEEELQKATGDGVDIYFDNVGGEILDSMLAKINQEGTVVACGGISFYNDKKPTVLKNYMYVVFQRLRIKGFIVTDFIAQPGKMQETQKIFIEGIKDGKLKIDEDAHDVTDTKFEDIPKTWLKLFHGGNRGKLVTHIVD